MPKQKTHSSAKKKFRVTGTGKLMRRSQMSGKLMNKSPKQKRQFSNDKPVSAADAKKVNKLLGRG